LQLHVRQRRQSEMRSSGTQFYIVQGVKLTDNELNQVEQQINNNIRQAIFNKLIKQVTDSANLSGKPLSDAEIQEKASLKMFEFLSPGKYYKILMISVLHIRISVISLA